MTTCVALLLSATALLIYELRAYRDAWVADLATQAHLLAGASVPALFFDDARAAGQDLALLRHRPQITAAAVYTANGELFAHYAPEGATANLPAHPAEDGYRIAGDEIELVQEVRRDGERIGSVYLRARYEVMGRLVDYLAILAAVMVASLVVATLVFNRLQHTVTRPILAVAAAAREVMEKRDYGLRVPKTTDDEIGALVDAFNNMLLEVGRRTEALERSNHELQIEMEQRQRAQAALILADRRKDEFLATLAHELRNPLAPLTNSLEILKIADADPATRERTRGIMERQVRQMVRLIDDLLEVSRITTGKLVLKRERIDLPIVLRTAIEIAEPVLRERRHEFVARMPDGPVWVDADATRLAQVFANLLSNAAKYTDAGGRIELEMDVQAQCVAVHVRDNGIGIDPRMHGAIFELFMQVDRSLERGRAGLGVGLTLARQLVEMHDGRIEVHSPGLGHGSQFTVELPLCHDPAASRRTPERPASGLTPSVPLDLLIADDNVDFATSLGEVLEALGHRVMLAHDGVAAMAAARARPPAVAFLDIGMPGLNGYEVARRLRAEPATRAALLVAVTGWGQNSDRERAREAGFDHHLVKPADLAQVLPLVESVARRALQDAPVTDRPPG
ncbi:ATP-binding protein [Schlegelella sp. S2-27]|uniref:histidine kinase n=1 Tax=Caldimonas mangrovi TaxID=2944811 RepID=A0ABT0YJ98_9BURK|nr:ATP-binding protein [Caldimonas mangrovi]